MSQFPAGHAVLTMGGAAVRLSYDGRSEWVDLQMAEGRSIRFYRDVRASIRLSPLSEKVIVVHGPVEDDPPVAVTVSTSTRTESVDHVVIADLWFALLPGYGTVAVRRPARSTSATFLPPRAYGHRAGARVHRGEDPATPAPEG